MEPGAVAARHNDLDKLYHEKTEFDTEGPGAKRFEEVLGHTTKIVEMAVSLAKNQKGRKKRPKLSVIATFLLVQDLSRNKYRKIERSFYRAVADHLLAGHDTSLAGKSTSGKVIAIYYDAWRETLLPHIGIELDPQRAFNDEQKAEIFARDGGICQVCKEPVEVGDGDYDHFPVRYEFGGPTRTENGRLVHRSGECHQRGRMPRHDDDADDGEDDTAIVSFLKKLAKEKPEDRSIPKVVKELQKLSPDEQEKVLAEIVKRNQSLSPKQ